MENLIVLKKEDLDEMLRKAVSEALGKKEPEQETLSIDEAAIYLSEAGYPIKKSSLYKKTSTGQIPFHRFGERKLIFKASELDEWANTQLKKVI